MTRLTTDNTIIRREIRKTVRSPDVRSPAHGGMGGNDIQSRQMLPKVR